MFSNNTHALGEQWVLGILNSIYVSGYIGKPNGDGTYAFAVAGKPGKVYLRLGTPENFTITEAVNFGAVPDPRLRVFAMKFAGEYIIMFPDPVQARELFGASTPFAASPNFLD